MLTTDIQPGVLLIGLAKLINSGRPGFDGYYRVERVGPQTVLEFFEGVPRPGMTAVKILPYRVSVINSVTVGAGEAISGEFTGCVMSLYREGAALKVGHVDTNGDTTQRAAYNALKASGAITVVDEYDSTGKLGAYPHATGSTVIICVASGTAVTHYFVDKELHQYSGNAPIPGGGGMAFGVLSETRYKVLQSFGH